MPHSKSPTIDESSLPALSFALIEARIAAMPEGTSAYLDTPRWAAALYLIGAGGAIVGLLPSVFEHFLEPGHWMAVMSQSGLAVMACACAVPFARSLWILWRHMSRNTKFTIEQMDHDRVVFGELTHWLARYPKPVIADHLRFAQHMQATMQAKVGLLAGGLDKMGILPAAFSAAIALQGWLDHSRPPLWLVIAAIFLALLWAIGVLASFARMRAQVFETLLSNAARLQDGDRSPPR